VCASMIADAHTVGAKVLIDGAQSVGHFAVDVQALDCDFFAFSGHKVFGPTGIGVLWGKRELLEFMPPYQGGGEMIDTVRFSGTTFNALPYKFEAGTPNIAGAIGLGAALNWLQNQDRVALAAHESALLRECIHRGENIGLQRIGSAKNVAGVYSFLIPGTHPGDVGTLLDQQGIAVRAGHHCAQPLMAEYGIPGTVRASFSIYNTWDDVDRLFAGLAKAKTFLL
jgi:cysteine desulfurase/selenocysteine lyase